MRNGRVELVAYDPSWPALYETERQRLEPLLLGALEIHHIGSTRAELERRLYFRDRLRADPALAAEYVALKRALAARYPEDREAYTEAKAPFIGRIEGQATSEDTRQATFEDTPARSIANSASELVFRAATVGDAEQLGRASEGWTVNGEPFCDPGFGLQLVEYRRSLR